ncbi:MAG: phosphate ABC transporter, permease protein PstA [Crocinitomicaceae bacterium]|nr:phosphate ABC transporter, permease protein PstA [Crocinitomicaceae bacterium]
MSKLTKIKESIFPPFALMCSFIGIILLLIFIGSIFIDGISRIDIDFLSSLPSRYADKAGILTSWTGTVWIMIFTALISIPVGIGAAIYMEEYSAKNRLNTFLEINISNLAGVPSIIYGLLGLEIFVRLSQLGNSILAGSLTLSLLILPIIIVATREAIKAVPNSIRLASYALGSSKWDTVSNHVLPAASGGILTGIILAISRAIGETAPLIAIGALAYVPFVPSSPMDEFSVLPIQIFNWTTRPQAEFLTNAAAAILILLAITFTLTGIAVYYRNKWQQKIG